MHWSRDVLSAAAVQPVALQPLALAQPGTDVSAVAEEEAHLEYTSNSATLGLVVFVCSDLLLPYLPLVDFCSSRSRQTADEDVAEEEDAAEFSEDDIWLKACTSFIRAR